MSPAELWERARRASGGLRPVLLIDGGAGAGKTTLARAVARAGRAQLVSMDDLYPGWDGLAAGSDIVARDVLRARAPGYRRWDWDANRPGPWRALDPTCALVVEGCGAVTPATRARATYAVWMHLDAETRRRRALARDGEAFRPHWDRWAQQEDAHRRRDRSETLADLVLRVPAQIPGPADIPISGAAW